MKLVELLASVVGEWPDGAAYAVQDGDKRQTIKFGVKKHDLGIRSHGHKDPVWQCDNWGFTHHHDVDHDELAADYETAIVTRAQWQAERDRQKGGEWKRHRGGPIPVDAKVVVEVKLRDSTLETHRAECFNWDHDKTPDDIMQYRIISQPQAEEPMKARFDGHKLEFSRDGVDFKEIGTSIFGYVAEIGAQPKTDQIDGPIKWRDTIIHCQAIIEDCEREIERNVQLLDAEGLMMQTDSKKAMQHYSPDADMSDWRNWKVGDIVRMETGNHPSMMPAGEQGEITMIADNQTNPVHVGQFYVTNVTDLRWVSRP